MELKMKTYRNALLMVYLVVFWVQVFWCSNTGGTEETIKA